MLTVWGGETSRGGLKVARDDGGAEKYVRDANLLEEGLKEHPHNARSQFYLAQSYKHAGHHQRAYEAYRKQVTMKGWVEQTFMTQLEVGRVAVLLAEPEEVVLCELLAAYEVRSSRAEPLYELARYSRLKKMYGKGYLFAKAGVQTPAQRLLVRAPGRVRLAVARRARGVGVVARQLFRGQGRLRGGPAAIEQGLRVPTEEAQRIRDNLAFCESELGQGDKGPAIAIPKSPRDSLNRKIRQQR